MVHLGMLGQQQGSGSLRWDDGAQPIPYLPGAGVPRWNAPRVRGGRAEGRARETTRRGVEAFAPEMLLPRRKIKSPPLGWTLPIPPRQPYVVPTRTRRVIGPVPKMSVGKHKGGLGQVVYTGGMQTPMYEVWTPMENAPGTNPDVGIPIPRDIMSMTVPGISYRGDQLEASYQARGLGHDSNLPGRYARAPQAQRFINQARSSGMWAQASFSPKQRPLIPSQQPQMLHRTPRRRQIPAHAPNYGLYTIGYPQSVGIAAGLGGGGPVAVLGGMSQ